MLPSRSGCSPDRVRIRPSWLRSTVRWPVGRACPLTTGARALPPPPIRRPMSTTSSRVGESVGTLHRVVCRDGEFWDALLYERLLVAEPADGTDDADMCRVSG